MRSTVSYCARHHLSCYAGLSMQRNPCHTNLVGFKRNEAGVIGGGQSGCRISLERRRYQVLVGNAIAPLTLPRSWARGTQKF